MIIDLSQNSANEINYQNVFCIDNYENSTLLNLLLKEFEPIAIPKSNVLFYYLEDGSKICAGQLEKSQK